MRFRVEHRDYCSDCYHDDAMYEEEPEAFDTEDEWTEEMEEEFQRELAAHEEKSKDPNYKPDDDLPF